MYIVGIHLVCLVARFCGRAAELKEVDPPPKSCCSTFLSVFLSFPFCVLFSLLLLRRDHLSHHFFDTIGFTRALGD